MMVEMESCADGGRGVDEGWKDGNSGRLCLSGFRLNCECVPVQRRNQVRR